MSTAVVFPRPLEVIPDSPTVPLEVSRPAPERRELVRLLLQRSPAFNDELQNPGLLAQRFAQLLGISVVAFAVHGLAVGTVGQLFDSHGDLLSLPGHPMAWVPIAMTVSLIGALGLCLPVFLFCGQVSGIEASPAVVAVQALRANATSALTLLGLLPVYIAIGLGSIWCDAHRGLFEGLLPDMAVHVAVALGFLLPILAGLFGITAIHRGFADLADRQGLPKERRGLLKGMIVCASLVYAVVAPVALVWLSWMLSKVI